MLNEEVAKYRELSGDTNPNVPISRIGGYLDGYEKALEQEPCKNTIDRQAVLDIVDSYSESQSNVEDVTQDIISDIMALSPVTSQEPCEMTAEEYRQRMIQAFHNANTDELIALCVLPTEKEFEHLEWLLKNHYKQKTKTGYWIRWYEQKETEWYTDNIPHCKCSECGKEYDLYSSQFIKYCPNCGAKMIEPQESEEE